MAFFLGIDAGGTHTRCAVGDGSKVLARVSGSSIKLHRVGREAATETLASLVRLALGQAGIEKHRIVASCIGIAGVSDPDVERWARHVMAKEVSGDVQIVGDQTVAFEAACPTGDGVLAIAGTGSIVMGRARSGDTARAGGWGPVASDQGSAGWIGRRAVEHALRYSSQRTSDALAKMVFHEWDAASPEEIARKSLAHPQPDFALLFPEVLHLGEKDSSARLLLAQAGQELAKDVLAVIRQLWPKPKTPILLRFCGGVLDHSAITRESMVEAVSKGCGRSSPDPTPVDPVLGALRLAEKTAASQMEKRKTTQR